MKTELTKETLPLAIKALFELNNYSVEGPFQLFGAEVDLLARNHADPFSVPVYIEATIEYVDNEKYGKDVGKLAMIAELEPNSRRIIVSTQGFTLPVKERALRSRIETLTYDELFSRFEKFDNYIFKLSPAEPLGLELSNLEAIYEEPVFDDQCGVDQATDFLTEWAVNGGGDKNWLVIVGEYGAGKTALTKVLQYRWVNSYKINPRFPIPFRIELRDFARQFDARGLLHHFLDGNGLGHVSIEFVYSLLKSGRIILLLDGYDEMAQYLHARERRTCLEALAELSSAGIKGIITSRPNYFTDTEELQIFEILYASLQQGSYYLTESDRELVRRESEVDQLLTRFLDRYERSLRELTQEQTEALVARALADDERGKAVILSILRRVFRAGNEGAAVSLSGKPVIITYLLQVVDGLKDEALSQGMDSDKIISDWGIYKMIVDQLMIRDLKRSPEMSPDNRREFLSKLAINLSKKECSHIFEDEFKEMISKDFSREVSRQGADARVQLIERYFADLRGSSTLTRARSSEKSGWAFSHNSLREYLVSEYFIKKLERGHVLTDLIPISDAMRIFVASRDSEQTKRVFRSLQSIWQDRKITRGAGNALVLIWDAALSLFASDSKDADTVSACLKSLGNGRLVVSDIEISRIAFRNGLLPSNLSGADFARSSLWSVDFHGAQLVRADFTGVTLDGVSFVEADLSDACFSGATLIDCDFSRASIDNCNFTGVERGDIAIFVEHPLFVKKKILHGYDALGYLAFSGALIDAISDYYIYRYYPQFPIVEKIIGNFQEQSLHQRRGLEQRGAARRDNAFAKNFIRVLETHGLLATQKNRKDLVEVTDSGREVFSQFREGMPIPTVIKSCLDK